jgi:phospholipid-binding lipoprotein MlaA
MVSFKNSLPTSWSVLLLVMGVFLFLPIVTYAEQDDDFDLLDDDFFGEEVELDQIYDPFEPANRVFFAFNDKLYTHVLNPVTTEYSAVVPVDVRSCIQNFFENLKEPVVFVNTILQGRLTDSGRVFLRFLVNSTLGVYGLVDVADREFEMAPVNATLGETLSSWGVGDGFYLVVPLLGSTTLRDGLGNLVETVSLTPYYSWSDDRLVLGGVYVGNEVNDLSFHLGEYEDLKALTLDPYSALRNIYMQHRANLRSTNDQDLLD